MDDVLISYFSTPNGPKLAKARLIGERPIPFGCFYDEGERIEHIKERLEIDVFPLLKSLLAKIQSTFDLKESELQVEGWIDFFQHESISNIDILAKNCFQNLNGPSTDDFSFYLNINCNSKGVEWGTQVPVLLTNESWQDLNAEEDFNMWFLSVDKEEVNIEQVMSIEKMEKFIESVMSELWRCYRIECTGNWDVPIN